ncbi:ATP-dependent DNA ligase [Pseudoflavitalea rhizosphaerae]|uniref:ATP-dependent DNA ligase n=1 Tax=Pseudoflavitalea rhizosphaerae TaxID=1884793 RepID=UPI000F8E8FB7|nr:ATP-dependent DNA ligase [Pseudoflavitalea rhizosphaerae]
MKAFAQLIQQLGSATATNDKLNALSEYFPDANDKDKVWTIALFSGRRPKRAVNSTLLSQWCIDLINLPAWLFEESYHTVGDLAETIALLLPPATDEAASLPLHVYLEKLVSLEKAPEDEKKTFIVNSWMSMSQEERFVFNKFITGGFRIGVSQKTIVNALARSTGLSGSVIAHRISGNWDPATTSYDSLLSEEAAAADISKPYPFYLAYALEDPPAGLGQPHEWQAEWKWDGIRGQIIKRNNQLFTWSRGEELITEKFPEYNILQQLLPNGIALDGEILPFDGKRPLPFSILQTRIGRKNVTKKQLQEAPAAFFVYDLLELDGADSREQPLSLRRQQLESIVNQINHPILQLSPNITFSNWDELATLRNNARDLGSEGLMLKRLSSFYQTGRKRGDWWKWKIDPLVIDCVMVYAMKGHGRRSNLYTDYTFAVKDGDQLVTFTKAYSGLTDEEFAQVDHFVKNNSLEKFGPVRTVKPELVFEIAFEGIAASNRHKSGVALRFPRISRWRKDKKPEEINTLEDLKQMLELYGK